MCCAELSWAELCIGCRCSKLQFYDKITVLKMNGKFERVVGILSLWEHVSSLPSTAHSLTGWDQESLLKAPHPLWLLCVPFGRWAGCVYCCVFHRVFVNGQLNVLPSAINTAIRIFNHQSCLPIMVLRCALIKCCYIVCKVSIKKVASRPPIMPYYTSHSDFHDFPKPKAF